VAKLSLLNRARGNSLLNGLARTALAKLLPGLRLRVMVEKDSVARRHVAIEDVYFPLTCVFSMVASTDAGQTIEVALIGNEGTSGVAPFLGMPDSPFEIFTQIPGEALSMRVHDFRSHLDRERDLTAMMGRYTQALLAQAAQSSACNRIHRAEARCARWLLMAHDRVGSDEFRLTQEFLSQMLGMRRATVSGVAAALQAERIIRYVRGTMTVLNRQRLAARSCGCYELIRQEYARSLL
jgi:CRP-like cAMP-binding protein